MSYHRGVTEKGGTANFAQWEFDSPHPVKSFKHFKGVTMSTKQKTMKKFRVLLTNGLNLVFTTAQDLIKEYDKLTYRIVSGELDVKVAELRLGAGGDDDYGFINYPYIISITSIDRLAKNHEQYIDENDLKSGKIITPGDAGTSSALFL